MRINKKKLVFPLVGLMLLVSCSGNKYEPLEQEELDAIIPELKIQGLQEDNGVLGNIYLPTEVNGATIRWKSSNPNVITDKEINDMAAGVVTRSYDNDIPVKLTAIIEKDGKRSNYEQEVNVLQLVNSPSEEDFCGYLFAGFKGESSSNGEQVYMSLADVGDKLKFKALNGGEPVLKSLTPEATDGESEGGVRDPYIMRSPEGDRYFLIGTNLKVNNRPEGGWRNTDYGYTYPTVTGRHTLILWQTTDLANWGEPTYIKVAPEDAGMAWAPEMVYHEETGQYVIFSSSCLIEDMSLAPAKRYKYKGDAVYFVTTRDFVHFSEPKLFIDNQIDGTLVHDPVKDEDRGRNIIDASCKKFGEWYYSATKDGDNNDKGHIRIMRTKDLLAEDDSKLHEKWEIVVDIDALKLPTTSASVSKFDNSTLEGPTFFRLNPCDWSGDDPEICLMADQYGNFGTGNLPFVITDIEAEDNSNDAWRVMSKDEFSFAAGINRHGSVLQLTEEEIEIVKAKWMK